MKDYYTDKPSVHIDEIEKFFQDFDFKKVNELKITSWDTITDLKKCVNVALTTLRAHTKNMNFVGRYQQLLTIYYICKEYKENDYKVTLK